MRYPPGKAADRLLLLTWNIANLGVQKRREKDYRLLAEIIGWFDLAAIQEVNDDLEGLRAILALLPDRYRTVFSDPGGNRERFAFVYDSKPEPPPAAGMDRRVLEAYAIARWASARHKDRHAYISDVIALGDFNLPVQAPGDRVYDALTRHGLHLPEHSTHVGGSNLAGDAHYDQMAFSPGPIDDAIEQLGIFDFDGALFRDLWGDGTKAQRKRFTEYVKYHVSDHRPLWMALGV